jgi:hypothetical protein
VAQEERFNDVWIMRKLPRELGDAIESRGEWPSDFDRYESLLTIGAAHGHVATFVNPGDALPIVIDLVGQRPEISDAEIASLVNVPQTVAGALSSQAREAASKRGYPYAESEETRRTREDAS